MGYYIETEGMHDKARKIVAEHGGRIESSLPSYESLQAANEVLVVVVDNEIFEAAGICYDKGEYDEFTSLSDSRPRKYVVLSKEAAVKAFAKDRENDDSVERLRKDLQI